MTENAFKKTKLYKRKKSNEQWIIDIFNNFRLK